MSHCTVLDLCHTLTVIAAVVMIQCDVITSQNGVFFAPFIFFIDFENCKEMVSTITTITIATE